MRPLPKNASAIADGWDSSLGIKDRARSLGWVGQAFTPDEWAYLSWNCDEARQHLPAADVSPERVAIRKRYDDVIAQYTERRDTAQIAYDQAVADEVREAVGFRMAQIDAGRPVHQQAEPVFVMMPNTGTVERRLDILKLCIADLSQALAERDAADRAQWAAESITGPAAEREPVRMSRGRRR